MFLDEHKLDKFRSFCYPVRCFSTLIEIWGAVCITGIRRSLRTSFQAKRFSVLTGTHNIFCLLSFWFGPGHCSFFCLVCGPSQYGPGQFFYNFFISGPGQSGPGSFFYFCMVSWVRYEKAI